MIIHGDSIEVLRDMDAESVDAVVTDPPYGLGNTSPKHVAECLRAWSEGETWQPTGRGFMGREWDAWVPPPELWREVLRVLKPGGHAIVFAGSRTQDLMSVALRLAGFEVRDVVMWLYGSGFPKSLNVSKAIDKQRDDQSEVYEVTSWIRATRDKMGLTNRMINERFGVGDMARHWTDVPPNGKQPTVPPLDQVPKLLEVLGVQWSAVPARVQHLLVELNSRKGQPAPTWFEREVIGEGKSGIGGKGGVSVGGECMTFDLTASATDEARTWEGWGTALKPAYEPAILARKPLRGTVARCVLEHGTGAINVDASRIASADAPEGRSRHGGGTLQGASEKMPHSESCMPAGRFPANVVINEHVAHELGERARYFYTPKASKAEREAGLEGWDTHRAGVGAMRDGGRKSQPRANTHPTVKPIALMRYLVRMVTPPSGTVLDPFAGSGSTLCAAALEGFEHIGVEREEEYAAIARARVAHWTAEREREAMEREPTLFD